MKAKKAIIIAVVASIISLGALPAASQANPSDNMQIVVEKIRADKKLFVAENMQLSEAEAKEFKPHSYCEELGYFRGNRQFLFHHLLSKLGFPVNSRWDRNGNWLW